MRDKRGAAHFEMIISFVFFMGFILFLFLVLKPYDSSVLSVSVVSGLYDSFEKEVYTNLTSIFLKADNTLGGCFSIDLPNEIFRYDFSNTLVTDMDGVVVESKMQGSTLNIDSDKVFFNVLMSSEFNSGEDLVGCTSLGEDYELGSLVEKRVVSYGSLVDMADEYSSNYDVLRSRLNVPEVFDFAIVSEDFPEVKMEKFIPNFGDVIAREYIIEVLNSDGEIINSKFNLKIW